jgi:hypothetical protein
MEPKLLDVVTLLEDVPAQKLVRGQVGTLIENLAPNVFEVEFSDSEGRTYASAALNSRQLLVLTSQAVHSRLMPPSCPILLRELRDLCSIVLVIFPPHAG